MVIGVRKGGLYRALYKILSCVIVLPIMLGRAVFLSGLRFKILAFENISAGIEIWFVGPTVARVLLPVDEMGKLR